MTELPLPNGAVALIDDEDAAMAAPYRWRAMRRPAGGRIAWFALGSPRGRTQQVYLHRLVLGEKIGTALVEHRNGNGLDCRKENLRVVPAATRPRKRATKHSVSTKVGSENKDDVLLVRQVVAETFKLFGIKQLTDYPRDKRWQVYSVVYAVGQAENLTLGRVKKCWFGSIHGHRWTQERQDEAMRDQATRERAKLVYRRVKGQEAPSPLSPALGRALERLELPEQDRSAFGHTLLATVSGRQPDLRYVYGLKVYTNHKAQIDDLLDAYALEPAHQRLLALRAQCVGGTS